MVGIQESARANAVIVVLKISVAVIFILLGWAYINNRNYQPFVPPNAGQFGHYGWSGVLRGAGKVFFAFIGFDAVSTAAQEARKPQKDMPIGIIGSLAICTLLYVVFSHVLTGIVNYADLDVKAPVAVAIDRTAYTWLRPAVKFAIILGFTSVILVMLLGQSRVFFSMARDRLLPEVFSNVHPKWRTPWRSNMLFMAFTGVFAAFAPLSYLGDMTSIGTLFAFVLVCLGILIMRRSHAKVPRPFKTPFVPVVPLLGIAFNLLLMFGLGLGNWIRLFGWMAIGLIIYFTYSRKRSITKD
jgi:APA family basic amino acid/polyamine antiporter